MTNPYVPADPPGDTTNRTAKMLLGIKGNTINNGGPITPADPPLASPIHFRHEFISNFGTLASMGPHAAGDEWVECGRARADLSKMKKGTARMQSHIIRPGAFGSSIVTRYAPAGSSTFADLISLPLIADADRPRLASVAVPDAACTQDTLLALVRRGGDGTISPAMWNAIIEIASGGSGTDTGGTPADLPEGDWGNVVWNLNAAMLGTMYADGDSVPRWPDTIAGRDAITNGQAVVNAPHYRATGMAGGLPCVQSSGLNLPLRFYNPTKNYGSWTYYFIISELDGADLGYIMNGSSGNPFGFAFWATSNAIWAHVHTNSFFSSIDSDADTGWNMGTKHIYRFVKDSPSVKWHMFRDGIHVMEETANPQVSDTIVSLLMDAAGGLGMEIKMGRATAYNRSHVNPNPLSGAPMNGYTAPELELKAFWGTP